MLVGVGREDARAMGHVEGEGPEGSEKPSEWGGKENSASKEKGNMRHICTYQEKAECEAA